MEDIELIALWYLRKKNKKKCHKRTWIHPINQGREEKGAFTILYRELTEDSVKFFNYFRMSPSSLELLLEKLRPSIEKKDLAMRKSISPQERLCLTLRYLASGCSMTDLHYSYRMGISTISAIIKEVCQAIWNCMKAEEMAQPTKEDWLRISQKFLENSNFPNCIGAVDGKHIRIVKPMHSGSLYYNYKNFFSIQLLAICDAEYRFTYVDIGDFGKNNDSSIFKNSAFNKKLRAGSLDIPEATFLPGKNDIKMPFALVGDEAFAMTSTMMRPYGGKNLSENKRVFNYRLSRARRFVECSFGILTNKWRIFHRPLNVNVDMAVDIVKACVILHNFVRVRDGYSHQDTLSYTGLLNDDDITGPSGGTGPAMIREYFTRYFVEEGEIPWQLSMIN